MKSIEKRLALSCLLSSERYKVVAITETWANESLSNGMLITDASSAKSYQYNVFRKDRNSDGEGGGVCLLVHKSLPAIPVNLPKKFETLEVVALDLGSQNAKQRIVCAYRPPGRFQVEETSYASLLAECISFLSIVAYPVSFVGDFNLPEIDWSTFLCPNDGVHDVLLDSFLLSSCYQFVEKPTRGKNVLDLILCSDRRNISSVKVSEPFSTSDHSSIEFSIAISNLIDNDLKNVRDWKNADYDEICKFLSSIDWDKWFSACANSGKDRVNDFYAVFLSALEACIHAYVPLRKLKKGYARKLPRRLRKLRARKNQLYAMRNNTENGRKHFRDASEHFRREIKAYAEKLENKCLSSGDVNKFYSFANSKLKSRSGIGPIKRDDGISTSDVQEKCEIFNSYFCSVFTIDDNTVPSFDRVVPDDISKDGVTITAQKVCNILRKLPNKTSGSPENVPALFLKKIATCASRCTEHFHGNVCICEVLSKVFNVSLETGELPDTWLTANIVPIFKKGDVSEAGNY